MTTHAIHWLGHHECHDDEIVGGKAASLSRLAAAHEVPAGFAVPALSPLATSMHPDLAGAIEAAYRALGERRDLRDLPVAVRSSAVDEDGVDSSFAGQHDTYLNVRGFDAVLDAVHRCVRSAASEEALAYRTQRGLAIEDVRIAVLIQELVPSDVSAVAFSANPVTGSRDEIMINANWGLGESIVGGAATPDTFVVTKDSFEVAWRDVAHKERMTVMAPLGTHDVDVPHDLRSKASLVDAQILQIARLAMMLEEAAGWAVDIECAIASDVLYLLQCRPITTLR
jgi:pyruvate,water dikinase